MMYRTKKNAKNIRSSRGKDFFCFVLFAVVSSAVNMCNQLDFRKKIYSAVQAEIVNHHLAEYFWHPQNLKSL